MLRSHLPAWTSSARVGCRLVLLLLPLSLIAVRKPGLVRACRAGLPCVCYANQAGLYVVRSGLVGALSDGSPSNT